MVIAIIAILAGLLLSALAGAKEKGRCAKCISNLRQVSLGFRTFALDAEGYYPWHVLPSDGGTYGSSAGTIWRNYRAASNELITPKILVCPSDPATKATVIDWSAGTNGLAHSANRELAVSYFIGLDSYEQLAVTLIAGDRNIIGGKSSQCASVRADPGVAAVLLRPTNNAIAWSGGIHGSQGNIAVSDGSVQKTRRAGLQQMIAEAYTALTARYITTSTGSRPDNHIQPPR